MKKIQNLGKQINREEARNISGGGPLDSWWCCNDNPSPHTCHCSHIAPPVDCEGVYQYNNLGCGGNCQQCLPI